MLFHHANAKSVKADIAKGEITLTFTVSLSEENMKLAQNLSYYVIDGAPDLTLSVDTRQMSLNLEADL